LQLLLTSWAAQHTAVCLDMPSCELRYGCDPLKSRLGNQWWWQGKTACQLSLNYGDTVIVGD